MRNLELIADAYRQIGILDENEVPSAEQAQQGLLRLNQLLAMWSVTEMEVPSWFTQTDLDAEAPLEEFAQLAVTTALSIALAAQYGVGVSAELASVTDSARARLQSLLMNKRLREARLPLPSGSGARR